MGKKKNKNKVSGAVKTAAKTEKKLANKLKKELATLGEEDITKVIAEIEREEAKRSAAVEKTLPGPPSARAYATLTPHPIDNELILFGGEYHNGKQTEVYNDLLFYNPVTNVWKQVKAPGAPPPRSAHQTVATQANKGEIWVFGGEFTSPSETQFYHYKDLWCFSLANKKWEKVVSPNGPSPRSGHRMVLLARKLYIFGGYADDGRDCRYFDDLYSFCLDTREWQKLNPSGRGPSARSACVMMPFGNDSIVITGGFSRVRSGRTERTSTHTDTFRATRTAGGWAWRATGGGACARAGLACAVNVHTDRGYVFGGVADTMETEEELQGELSDELQVVDLATCRWHPLVLKHERPPPDAEMTPTPQPTAEDVTVISDDVFTMKLGSAPAPATASLSVAAPVRARSGPGARMSAMLAVQRSMLYVYGGVLEKDDKQFYLSDLYSLDLHKLVDWRTVIAQPKLPDWFGSDSEDDASGSESETDDSEDEE
ncbi:kelch domain-containing protein 4 [Leptidea sinapis]|uniref:kelch domain-containing protein 4 n=1 Tax=Leptidea sinapis TaxID=189913 RepID=UPI00213A829F|nr:kelch domain-containing protein 4 [Leptidea sinapis]